MAVHWGGRGPGHVSRGGGLFASLRLDFLSNVSAIDPRITFTRASSATRVNASGLIETVSSNVARIDYDPVTLAAKGLLIEEQRTNLLLRSQEFDNASWTKVSATITANAATAPDGTMSADRFVSAGGAYPQMFAYATVPAGDATVSVYVKSDGTPQIVQTIIYEGVVKSFTPTSVWTRVTLTKTAGAGGYQPLVIATNDGASPASSYYIWGAQIEAGAFATSYIPTTSATVTRAVDVASITGTNFSDWFNATEGTFVVEADTSALGTFPVLLGHDSAAYRNFLFIKNSTSIGTYNGSVELATSGGTVSNNNAIKTAMSYSSSGRAVCLNGGTVGSDANAINTVTGLYLGKYGNVNFQTLNGHLRRVTYYPARLSNALLQSLTA